MEHPLEYGSGWRTGALHGKIERDFAGVWLGWEWTFLYRISKLYSKEFTHANYLTNTLVVWVFFLCSVPSIRATVANIGKREFYISLVYITTKTNWLGLIEKKETRFLNRSDDFWRRYDWSRRRFLPNWFTVEVVCRKNHFSGRRFQSVPRRASWKPLLIWWSWSYQH